MSTAIQAPSPALEAAAHIAGLNLTAAEPGIDFTGAPTTRAIVTLAATPPSHRPRASSSSNSARPLTRPIPSLPPPLPSTFARSPSVCAIRARTPMSRCTACLSASANSPGPSTAPPQAPTPSSSRRDPLEDGRGSQLHAKVSASMTQTFATVIPALEQPFAEGFIYNAVRKTLDQGQLELVHPATASPSPSPPATTP